MRDSIRFSTFLYGYSGHPHGVIMDYGLDLFGDSISFVTASRIEMDFDLLDKTLTQGFKKNGEASFYGGDTQAEQDLRKIGTSFNDDFYEDGEPENLVPPFEDTNKYVFRVCGSFWGYWNKNRPFEFPAVAYSRDEIYAWFVWAAKKMLLPRLRPDSHNQFWEIAECFVDVQEADLLMESRLSGAESWAYGPAREKEPNFDLWHELTQVPSLNRMISSYPNFTPSTIEWWKSQSWSSRYEFDLSAFVN